MKAGFLPASALAKQYEADAAAEDRDRPGNRHEVLVWGLSLWLDVPCAVPDGDGSSSLALKAAIHCD